MLRAVGFVCLFFGGTFAIRVGVFERFRHPHLTETELFLAHWPLCTAGVVLALIGYALILSSRR